MSEPVSESQSAGSRFGGWVSVWFTVVLAVSAAITVGFWLFTALGEADTESLESPLMLSVARQLMVGPGELYGPFGGRNPLVLIHAPLYYRVARSDGLADGPRRASPGHGVAGGGPFALGPGPAGDLGSGLPTGPAGRRFPARGVLVGAVDRRIAGPRRSAVRRAAGHDGRGVADVRGSAGALGPGGRERFGSARDLGLCGVSACRLA